MICVLCETFALFSRDLQKVSDSPFLPDQGFPMLANAVSGL